MTPHLRAAAGAVRRPAAAVPLVAAVVLVAACTTGLDDGVTALQVLRLAAVLLAVAVATAADEPLARLLDASPTPWAVRVAARLAPVLAAAALVWALVVGWASVHGDVPVAALTLELLALVALAGAVATGLRRWRGTAEPAVLTGPVLAGLLLLAAWLPRAHALLELETTGPHWTAAHQRWAGLLLAGAVLLALGLRDPATSRRRPA